PMAKRATRATPCFVPQRLRAWTPTAALLRAIATLPPTTINRAIHGRAIRAFREPSAWPAFASFLPPHPLAAESGAPSRLHLRLNAADGLLLFGVAEPVANGCYPVFGAFPIRDGLANEATIEGRHLVGT